MPIAAIIIIFLLNLFCVCPFCRPPLINKSARQKKTRDDSVLASLDSRLRGKEQTHYTRGKKATRAFREIENKGLGLVTSTTTSTLLYHYCHCLELRAGYFYNAQSVKGPRAKVMAGPLKHHQFPRLQRFVRHN
jgi:hypothetical protein